MFKAMPKLGMHVLSTPKQELVQQSPWDAHWENKQSIGVILDPNSFNYVDISFGSKYYVPTSLLMYY